MDKDDVGERFADCGQCGWLGPVADLKEHPTRPVAMDLGFCPQCGAEIDEVIDRVGAESVAASYGETLQDILNGGH